MLIFQVSHIRTSPQIVRHILYVHNIQNNEMSSLICFLQNLQDLRNIKYDFNWYDLNKDKRTLPRWRLLRPGERKICKNNFPFDTDRLQH